MSSALSPEALGQLFRDAHTYYDWSDTKIDETVVRALYDLLKFGPTSANSCPARFVWVHSDAGKAKLAACAADNNRQRILAAPLTVIIAHDLDFVATLPKLLPPAFAETMTKAFQKPGLAEVTAMRNGTLQGAYLILAARALGLDCGPMSGFDNAAVDQAFFPGASLRSNFICCLGYGKQASVRPRNPRLGFEEAGWFA